MKNWKLLFYSLTALGIYFLFDKSPLFDGLLQKLEKANSTYAIGYYILIKIGGWFLLLFGTLGILMFLYYLIKTKD
ncbi:hypothetical protein [Polaribacter porphyrae]|uniref:Uncharacterized protein n=1 Tax=Polaribacter porphyrae TaxID=1137780 RepID=A0A2S7WTC8_9FLAO|nr:hypothetical protein [Polaribacter porphyrae]PQJ80561.1 hypothetical protein BTO18_15860 [Polaribacter porphyrae]